MTMVILMLNILNWYYQVLKVKEKNISFVCNFKLITKKLSTKYSVASSNSSVSHIMRCFMLMHFSIKYILSRIWELTCRFWLLLQRWMMNTDNIKCYCKHSEFSHKPLTLAISLPLKSCFFPNYKVLSTVIIGTISSAPLKTVHSSTQGHYV